MPSIDRRRFLQVAGGATATTLLTDSIARAASLPANHATGSLDDVEHIVVLMQENRSFDHYFGTLRGVRGFGDPHPATLPSGKSVFHQPNGDREVLPFRPDMEDLGKVFLEDLPHGWSDTQGAINRGVYDGWIPNKTATTMAHLRRNDAPFHFALADAFTVCDAYHCSFIGNTDPNRYYMWSGWTGNDGKGGGPVLYNDEAGYDWTTYPERLEEAGVSWKIYQDIGLGLDQEHYWGWTDDAYIGNYGDNSLLYFHTYQNAAPGTPLAERAKTGTNVAKDGGYFDVLREDVRTGKLPQVSWVVAPEAFTEHPNWPVNFGAWYVANVLDALTSDPEVWAKTALLVTYDENDGFFDHVVPPHANSPVVPGDSTVPTENEFYTGPYGPGSYGLGQRVPMIVVSPWSTGGWVCSETFDHTSIIRLIEQRFGVEEPNITPWRRSVCGDLTSAFDFTRRKPHVAKLPDTSSYEPTDHERHPDYQPTPPAHGTLPKQERGTRASRPLAYDFAVVERRRTGALDLRLVNDGPLGAQLQARFLTPAAPPRSYTVGAGDHLDAEWPVTGAYDVTLHGPNGFFRRFTGRGGSASGGDPVLTTLRSARRGVTVALRGGRKAVEVTVTSAYDPRDSRTVSVPAGGEREIDVETRSTGGWYDVRVEVAGSPYVRVLAGHLEDGRPSISDPALGH
ncbi:phospholipase C, phosphocholine-specific [Nocardioides sp. KIGAM211]|uniref:phospholipase C n=1 Tax=Nocardioides luti TaxID=2761101 RepID=A0A7X0RH86_9ACTN|nr:phospholipase C, phosphocholine-specific [Nocardioides luti]